MDVSYEDPISHYFNKKRVSNKVWIDPYFRAYIVKKAIEKAGSLNEVGRVMGYRSRIHPGWSVRQILVGIRPVAKERLNRLLSYLNIPYEEAEKHIVTNNRYTTSETYLALKQYGFLYYLSK
ncbi:MAG: hypothetical protein ACP5RS_01595 [Thermoplasmata archaeon]